MVNEGIRARELRLIADDGAQLGVKSKQEALQMAEQANLDLVFGCTESETTCCQNHGLWEVSF